MNDNNSLVISKQDHRDFINNIHEANKQEIDKFK